MAYDGELASRLRALLSEIDGISERRMFGGLSFLRDGNLVCGVMDDTLLVRLGEAQAKAALADPHVRLMDLQRRPSRAAVYVEPAGCADDEALRGWVDRALGFVATLPPKSDRSAARDR
jgi:TfoX/Sxy family transcriptional regulator of competence genes